MPQSKSGFKNWQRITALFLVFIFSAEQISYAGGLNDTWSNIKTSLKSSVSSAKTFYHSGTQSMRANFPNVFNAAKPLIAAADLVRGAVTRSSPAFYNSWTAGNRQALPNAARAYDSNGPFGAAFYGVGLVTNPVIEKVTGIKAGSAEAKTKLQDLHKWIPAPVNLAIKASIGKDLDNPYASTKQGWDKITSITPKEAVIGAIEVGFPVIGKGLTSLVKYAGISSTSLGLGATSTYITTKVLPPITRYVGSRAGQGLSYAWQGAKGALTLPERLVTPYISSSAGRWLAVSSIRFIQYETGLYGFRQSGLEDKFVPMAYRPAVDTTLDYVVPFFIAPGRGGVAKDTAKAFFSGGGIKTFAKAGVEQLSNLKNKATFGTLKAVVETLPAKLTRDSIKSGIVNAGKIWAAEAKLGYVNLASEGKAWVPVQMLRQGVHVAQDLAVFQAGSAVFLGALNKAGGYERVNIPYTNIGFDTLKFKNLPDAANTISEYAASGAISGLTFGSAMSIAGPVIGPVISRTPVLGRFMRWYDDTYGNKLFETAGLEKRLAGNSFWSKQGISFINKFNRAQNFLAEEFWVFREPLAGAVFSRLPLPSGAQEYLEESITDYGKRGPSSISFGLDTLHGIQAEGGVGKSIAKKLGGIAVDTLGAIELPNPFPMVVAAAPVIAMPGTPVIEPPNTQSSPAVLAKTSITNPITTFNIVSSASAIKNAPSFTLSRPSIQGGGVTRDYLGEQIASAKESVEAQKFLTAYKEDHLLAGSNLPERQTETLASLSVTANQGTNNYLSKFVQGPFLEMSKPDYNLLVKNPASPIETYKAISSITIPYKEKILGELEDAKSNNKPVVKYYHAASLEKALFVERTGLYNPALSLINPANTANERPTDTRKIYSYVSQENKDNYLNDYTDPARQFLIEISVPVDSQFSQIQGKSSDALYFSGIASARVLGADELPVGVIEQRINKGGPAASYYTSQLSEKSYVQVSDASVLNILMMQENKDRVFSPYGSKAVGYYIPENINIKPNNQALGYRQDGSLDIFNIKTGEVIHHAEPVFFENSNFKPADVITMPQAKDFTKSPAITKLQDVSSPKSALELLNNRVESAASSAVQQESARLAIIINDLRSFLQSRGAGNVSGSQLQKLAENIYKAQLIAANGAVVKVDLTGLDIPGITSADSRALGTMGMGGLPEDLKGMFFGQNKLSNKVELEFNKLLEKTVVQIEGTVTFEELKQKGFAPQHKIPLNGVTYYLSEPYMLKNRRPYFIGYIHRVNPETGKEEIFARTIWKSLSQSTWRVASHQGSDGSWIGKGLGEETTDAPLEIQSSLEAIYLAKTDKGKIETKEGFYDVLDEGGNMPPESFQHTIILHGEKVNEGNRVGYFKEKGNPASFTFLPGYEPDFKNGKVEEFESSSPLYGRVKSHRILSTNKKVQYLFNVDTKDRVWIGAVQATSSRLTRFGVRADLVKVDGDLLMPANEYDEQIPTGYIGELVKDQYYDASKFLNEIPVIQEFRRSVLRGSRREQEVERTEKPTQSIKLGGNRKGGHIEIAYTKPIKILLGGEGGKELWIYAYEDLLTDKKAYLNSQIEYFIVDLNDSGLRDGKSGFKALRDNEKVVIGRNSPGRFILNDYVSGDHIKIERSGDKLIIDDLKSLNGTEIGVRNPTIKADKDGNVYGGGLPLSRTSVIASQSTASDTAISPAKLDSSNEIYAALGKVIEPGPAPRPLDKFLAFIIERHSLHDKLRGILDRVLRRKPQAEIEISRPDTQTVKESPATFEYVSPSQKFQGVDLEHFVHAQRRLARKELSREELRGVLKKLGLKQELANEDKLDLAYAGIYKELARGNYNKDIIDTINGFDPLAGKSTYSDPRLNIAIIDQSGDARSQGVYEAISNSLDALGFKIGQFGKGVKQIIDWLEPTGKDRIDVYSKKENEPAYQLTILKDTKGQNYLQIQIISDTEFRDTAKAVSSRAIDRGTIVKVTTQKDIPLEDSQHKEQNSRGAIAAGIHKRFPFITNIPILIQIDNQEPQKVNGFREKKVIVPARQKIYQPKEKEDNFVHMRLDKHNIAIVDNGKGMDARVLAGMFVPEGGTKSPEFLSGRQIEEELGKVEVVHDKNLPHRVSFARNGEVIFTVDIPQEIHPDATLPGAGGLMLELGLLLDVQESRDRIVLKVGKENGFQKGVMYAVSRILKHPELSAADKIRYINTIVIGLDGLIKGNENNAEVIKAIRQNILAELQAVIDKLRSDNFVILPYQKEFGKFKVPQGKNVLFVHENLFHWGIDTLKELGAEIVPGIKLAGDKRLPLVVVPFKEEHLSAVSTFNKNWHTLNQDERVPVIKTDRFVAIPGEFGRKVLELSQKRIKGLTQGKEELTEAEKLEFASLLELIKIITSDEVVTSYEVAPPKESLKVEEIKFQRSEGQLDSDAINKFLTQPPEIAILKAVEDEKSSAGDEGFKSEIENIENKVEKYRLESEADSIFKEAYEAAKTHSTYEKMAFIISLAELLADSNRKVEADLRIKEAYEMMIKVLPKTEVLIKSGQLCNVVKVLVKLDHFNKAIQIAEQEIKEDYWKSIALSSIAKALVKSDRLQAENIAKKAFDIANSLTDDMRLGRQESLSVATEALVLADSGMVNEAVSVIEKEFQRIFNISNDDGEKAYVIGYFANVLAKSGRINEVFNLASEAEKIKEPTEKARAWFDIALVLADTGRHDEALLVSSDALDFARLSFEPNVISDGFSQRAKVLAKLGSFDEALSIAEKNEKINDEDRALLLTYIAEMLIDKGNFDKAESTAKEALDIARTRFTDSPEPRIKLLCAAGKALAKLAQARSQISSVEAQFQERPETFPERKITNQELIEQAITQANAIEDPFHKSIALIPVLKKLAESGRMDEAENLIKSISDDKRDDLGTEGVYYYWLLHSIAAEFRDNNIGMLITIATSDTPILDKSKQRLLHVVGVYALVEAGAIDEAIKLIDSIGVIEQPNYKSDRARACIVKALVEAGRTEEAIKQVELIGFNTSEVFAHILEILVDAGKTDEAIKIVGNYVPSVETYGPILKALVKAGRRDEATELIRPWLPNYNAGALKEEFLSTLIKALDEKTDNKIVAKLVNQIINFPAPEFEKAYLSSILITAIPDRIDEKIIDKLIEQVIAGKSENTINIMIKALVKASKIDNARKLVNSFETSVRQVNPHVRVSFVEALMSQAYKETTITTTTPPALATAKQDALFSDTKPQDAPNEFEIIPHPNGKFYVKFDVRNLEPKIKLQSSEGRLASMIILDEGVTEQTRLFTRIERVGTKDRDTFIGYGEDGTITIFRAKTTAPLFMLLKLEPQGNERYSVVDNKGGLVIIEKTKADRGKGYFLFDANKGIFAETPRQDEVLAKKISLSASGRFSIHEEIDGSVIYYDHEDKPAARAHIIIDSLSHKEHKGYRVHEKADVVILQRSSGKYQLFNLKRHSLSLYVDHIEIDSSGQVAIFKKDGKLGCVGLGKSDPIISVAEADKIRISSNDEYTYLMAVFNDRGFSGYYFNKNSGDAEDGLIGRFDAFTDTEKEGEYPYIRYWEEYDLDRKAIWDRETNSLLHGSDVTSKGSDPFLLNYYFRDSPIDPERDNLLLYDNVTVQMSKKLDGRIILRNLDADRSVNDSAISSYHTKDALSLQGGKVWYILFANGTCKVVEMGEDRINHVARFSRFFVTRNNKFILGEDATMGTKFLIDNKGNLKYLDDVIPEGFIPTEANGDYFVFVNPKTRQTKYLDPRVAFEKTTEQEETLVSFETQIARQKAKEEAEKIIKHWQDNVLSKRDAFIAQAQAAYQPILELAPPEHKIEVEKEISKQIIRLYEEQDKAIRKRFAEAQDKSGDIDFTELPFEHFEKTMRHIKPVLKEYVGSLNNRISQEPFDTQRDILVSLFTNLFEFSMHPELSLEAFDANLLEIISSGWDISTQEGLDIAPVIGGLIQGLKEINPAIGVPRMRKIIHFLSDFLPGNPVNNKFIVEAQLKKILEAKEQIRKSYLEKMLVAFKDIGQEELEAYLNQPSAARVNQLGQAREFVVFLTNKVEHLENRERFIPEGIEKIPAGKEVSITQIMQLEEKRRKSVENNEPVMPVEELISAIDQNNLPEPSKEQEAKILLDTKVQRESGAYTAEITQNSKDATKGKKGELLVSFYLQENEQGAQEYIEEATDNGTGALNEIALLIPKSTKSGGGQIDLAGFFGTGKYTIFEGADRIEIISKNDRRAYMFSFLVNRDPSGNPVAIRLTNIRQVNDAKVAQGVTVRRIKATVNTIPELDQMLARRSWKTFAGLSQNDNFNIYFVDKLGKKELLEVKKEVLSQADFIVPKRGQEGQVNFGTLRIISCEDMPLQVVDRTGLRIGEIKEEYLELIPESLRKHIEELGIIIQIPLPLIRNRSDFELANYYLPYIQKYIAIEFYKVLAYKALTQTAPQFVFENLPFDWETNDDYWDSINLQDKDIVGLADKINKKDFSSISGAELKSLLPGKEGLDTEKKLLKLILLLKVDIGKPQPESLLLRRLAVQAAARNQANAKAQMRALEAAGMKVSSFEVPDSKDIPHLREKLSQALGIKTGHEQMKHLKDYLVPARDYTPQEKKLVELARSMALLFGLEDVLLVEDNVSFAGGFTIVNGKRVMALQRSLANQIGMASRANVDEAANTIVHELAHLLEEFMRQGPINTIWDLAKVLKSGYITPNFTHDAVGTFAEAMKYVAAVTLANHNGKSLP